MSTNLKGIGEKARKEPELVFTSLYHHIYDVDNLRACYDKLRNDKAVGVDGVTKEEYGKGLETKLSKLSKKLRQMGYRPRPKRRVNIPKAGSKKGRPLGISCFEDKIVELAVKMVLEPIYEAVFLPSSYGYRPGLSQHKCLDKLGKTLQRGGGNYVVEADIRGFFNEVNWEWMVKFLEHRIGDSRVIRLIQRMLRAGVMEDGLVKATTKGTPQGSVLSPLISNIYLHYALDLWFEHKVRKQSKSVAYYFRFADDFLASFQKQKDAERFLKELKDRLEKFGLELAESKTRMIEFGRFARENASKKGKKPAEFTFLGFTHYSGKTKNGHFKVKRRTSRKKLGESLKKFGEWARKARSTQTKREMLEGAKRRINGHLNYYAITDNSKQCCNFMYYANRLVFKWINRKSQRKTYTWEGFNQVIKWLDWPKTNVRVDLDPCHGAEAL